MDNLGALITAFTDGYFAEKILQLFPSAGSTQKQALQLVINRVAEDISKIKEQTSGLATKNPITATFNITAANTTITLKNLIGMPSIDWGDGTVNNSLNHTYTTACEYTAKIYGVTQIGDFAFESCANLTIVVIGNGVTGIGIEAFAYCSNLTNVIIGDNVTSIGDSAFNGCSNLIKVNFKRESPIELNGANIFSGCNLSKIIVPAGCLEIYKSANGAWSSYLTLMSEYALIDDVVKKPPIPEYVSLIKMGTDGKIETVPVTIDEVKPWSVPRRDANGCIKTQTPVDKLDAINKEYLDSLVLHDKEKMKALSKEVEDLYLLSNATVTGTEKIDKDYTTRKTANGLSGLIDGALTKVKKIRGKTVFSNNLLTFSAVSNPNRYSEGLLYENVDSTSYRVTGIGACEDSRIVIPSSHNGLPVVSIGPSAFIECNSFNSVKIPDNIISIEHEAFKNCNNLTKITIPKTVTRIGRWAFSGCTNLTSIVFEGTSAQWNSVEKKDGWNHKISATITYTEDETFSEGLQYVMEEYGVFTVTGIGACTDNNLVIPSTYNGFPVKAIGDNAFYYCTSLTSVTIPDSVTRIGEKAFCGCNSLTEIRLDSIEIIGLQAFYNCANLSTVTIGNNITSIGGRAFDWCQKLTQIRFSGTRDEWKNVAKGYGWANNTQSEVYYKITTVKNSDGSITLNGIAIDNVYIGVGKMRLLANTPYYQSVQGIKIPEGIQFLTDLYDIDTTRFSQIAYGNRSFTLEKPMATNEVLHLFVCIPRGTNCNNVTIYPMLNEGTAQAHYQPRFDGYKNAWFKGIKSTGKNILKFSPRTHNYNGVEATFNADGSIKLQGTAEKDCYIGVGDYRLQDGVNCCQHLKNNDANNMFIFSDVYNDNIFVKNVSNGNTIFTTPTLKGNEIIRVFVFLRAGTVVDEVVKPFLGYGETEIEYEPYKEDTSFMLDNAVELGEYDYIEPENNKIIKATRTVILDGVENKFNYIVNHSTFYNCCISIGRSNGLNAAKSRSFIINNGFSIGYGDYLQDSKGAIFSVRNEEVEELSEFCVWFTKDAKNRIPTLNENGVPSVDEANDYLKSLANSGNPLTISYQLKTPTEEEIGFSTNKYQAWNGGSETVLQGDTENSMYGAKNTFEQIYAIKRGIAEP